MNVVTHMPHYFTHIVKNLMNNTHMSQKMIWGPVLTLQTSRPCLHNMCCKCKQYCMTHRYAL